MSVHPAKASALDATIRIDQVPPGGRDLKVVADAEQLAALAERLKVSAVEKLEADLHVVRFRGGIRVRGEVRARIVQPCVVSFVPVTQDIVEPVDRIFLPGVERDMAEAGDAEIFVDPEGEDFPDRFDGVQADLSELLIELVALAIDPYPRAPGAKLEGAADEDAVISPFSSLKVLKDSGQ